MKADTLADLYSNARVMTCCAHCEDLCVGRDCMAWREKAIPGRKTSAHDDPPVAYYKGWCGLAGEPEDENDYRSKENDAERNDL